MEENTVSWYINYALRPCSSAGLECRSPKPKVMGSNPIKDTIKKLLLVVIPNSLTLIAFEGTKEDYMYRDTL